MKDSKEKEIKDPVVLYIKELGDEIRALDEQAFVHQTIIINLLNTLPAELKDNIGKHLIKIYNEADDKVVAERHMKHLRKFFNCE